MKMFTVYDSKAQYYKPPFHIRATGEAIRAFDKAVNDPQTELYANPEDFVLYEIGHFDDLTGSLVPLQPHRCLGKGIEYKQKAPLQVIPAVDGKETNNV